MTTPGSLHDQPASFGWISITLHWLTAIIITVLWFLGRSIEFQPVELVSERRSLHVTLGLIAWLLLAGRIAWRIRQGHPRAHGQTELIHRVARLIHYLMLTLLSVMLLSGPLLALTLSSSPGLASLAHTVHEFSANLLLLLVLVHIAGALKHLMFNSDETLARIFVPRGAPDAEK